MRGITCLKMLYTQDRRLYFATDYGFIRILINAIVNIFNYDMQMMFFILVFRF